MMERNSKRATGRVDGAAPAPPLRLIAGFWEKAGAWALPRDARGEGYADLLRGRKADIGFCMLFIFASGWGQTFVLSLFQPHWRATLGLSNAAIGALYGGATLASGLLLPAAGRWLDRTPTGRAAAVTLAGLMLGSLLAAAAYHVWLLAVALFTLRFFGQGMSTNVGITRAARWFDHNRGKAVSLATLGFPLAEAVLPAAATLLIALAGWRGAWLVFAGVCAATLMPAAFALLASRRKRHGRSAGGDPEARPAPLAERRGLLRDWRFYAMLTVTAPVPFVGTGVIFFQGTIGEARGWSAAVFPTGFVLFAAVRALFALSAGAWVDRVGSLRLLALPTTLFAFGLLVLTRPEPVCAYIFFAMLGIGFGASSGIMITAWTDLFGVQRIGLIKGMSSSVAIVSTALAPVVFGLLFEAGVPHNAIFLGGAAFMVSCSWPMSLLLARRGAMTDD